MINNFILGCFVSYSSSYLQVTLYLAFNLTSFQLIRLPTAAFSCQTDLCTSLTYINGRWCKINAH